MGKNLLKAIGLSVLLLTGCDAEKDNVIEEDGPKGYFTEIKSVDLDSGISIVTGDFNGDGHLDLVVGTINMYGNNARIRLYEGDGEGNFKLKKYYTTIKIE